MTQGTLPVHPGLALTPDGQPPERPRLFDLPVVQAAAKRIAQSVWDDMGKDNFPGIQHDLEEILIANPGIGDGYKLAKRLESRGYAIDAHMVEVVDCVNGALYEARDDETAKWVVMYQIKPAYFVGQDVTFTSYNHRGVMGEFSGRIIDIDRIQAKYIIYSPELGHVPRGQQGVQAVHIPYERVKGTFSPIVSQASNTETSL